MISNFIKPDLRKLTLFLFFSFICIGGVIQTYAFVDDVPGLPKPSLYDVLRPLDLWFPWIVFAGPVHILGYSLGLTWIMKFFPELGGIRFPVASVVYSYIVSCLIIYTWDRWLSSSRPKVRFLIVFLPLTISIAFTIPAVLLKASIGYYTLILSGFAFFTAALMAYSICIYGLTKLTYNVIANLLR